MGNIPNLIDIDSYCNELSSITEINVEKIRTIVLASFAKIYNPSSENMDFTDATGEIESQIFAILDRKPKKIVQLSL